MQRFIWAKKIFLGYGHFKGNPETFCWLPIHTYGKIKALWEWSVLPTNKYSERLDLILLLNQILFNRYNCPCAYCLIPVSLPPSLTCPIKLILISDWINQGSVTAHINGVMVQRWQYLTVQYLLLCVTCMDTACYVHVVHALSTCNAAIPLTGTVHLPFAYVAQFQIPNLQVKYMYFCDLWFLRVPKKHI